MFPEQLQFIVHWRSTVANTDPGWRLYDGRAVRNLVGRPAGALRGRKGFGFDIHQIL